MTPVVRGDLAGLEIAADRVDPALVLNRENSGFDYFTLLDAGSYLSASAKFGSPAYDQSELAAAPESGRAAADKVLGAALGLRLDRASLTPRPGGAVPPARRRRAGDPAGRRGDPAQPRPGTGGDRPAPLRDQPGAGRARQARPRRGRGAGHSDRPLAGALAAPGARRRPARRLRPALALLELRADVVAAAQVVLQEDVEDDEQVAAAHLLDRELALARGAVAPRDRDHGEAVAADDRLQRQLHREVEVVGEQRLDGLDHLAAVGLEGVRRVVEAMAEQDADEPVREPVQHQLGQRVVDHRRLGQEARAEDAVVALLEQAVVAHQVVRVVGAVGHHQRHRVALEAVEARADREPEPARVVRAQAPDLRVLGGDRVDDRDRAVHARVVDHEDLVLDAGRVERPDRVQDRLLDRPGLVVGGHDDRELHRSKPSDAATASSLAVIQAWMSASISRGSRCGRHAVAPKSRAQSER